MMQIFGNKDDKLMQNRCSSVATCFASSRLWLTLLMVLSTSAALALDPNDLLDDTPPSTTAAEPSGGLEALPRHEEEELYLPEEEMPDEEMVEESLASQAEAALAEGDDPVLFEGEVSAKALEEVLFPKGFNDRETAGIDDPNRPMSSIRYPNDAPPGSIPVEPQRRRPRAVALRVQFAFDSHHLLPEARYNLDQLGSLLRQHRSGYHRLMIEGHTDASGDDIYNQGLSERRARSVKRYLVQAHGISPHRLLALGRGERRPLRGYDPYSPVNRRVEFRVSR